VPHHWSPIKKGAGGQARVTEVQAIAVAHGGDPVIVGPEQGSSPERWYAAIEISNVADPTAMWSAIGTNGAKKVIKG
jgi:hypothetical protein